MKVSLSLSPYIILCGWLGLKHQLNSVFRRLDIKKKYSIKHVFNFLKLCSVQNTVFSLFSVWHTQYYTSMITDQIYQDDWAFVRILNLLAGLCPVGPSLVGFCWKSVGYHSSNLNLHIKKSPNCAAFSVACALRSVHITPIVMSAPLTAAKARIPCKCMPMSQRHHLPHSCESPWPPTAVLPFMTTPPRYRHQPLTTPTLQMQDERWLCTPSFRPICPELTASSRRKCNNHWNVQVSTQTVTFNPELS